MITASHAPACPPGTRYGRSASAVEIHDACSGGRHAHVCGF